MALFREYDLRGIVGEELTEAVAEQVGRAYATMAKEQGASRISLGRDGRLSSPALQQALLRGLLAGGLDVVDLGLCASPLLYFSLFTLPVHGGIMITGSHNAAEYNGFKICIGKEAIHGEEIQHLRRIMESGRFSSGSGQVSAHPIIPDYLQHLKRHSRASGPTIFMSSSTAATARRRWSPSKRWNRWDAASPGSTMSWTGGSRTITRIRRWWKISRI
jgi:phosphomannomutase/phosphoglucomutase